MEKEHVCDVSFTLKNEAEARFFDAQTSEMKAQELETRAKVRLAQNLAVEGDLKLQQLQIITDNYLQEDKRKRAGDYWHHTYHFEGEVNSINVTKCISSLQEWVNLAGDEKLDIKIYINSEGGGVTDGFILYDFIRILVANEHKITTIALGMAASMAGVILQAGSTRVMGEQAILLIHEADFNVGGNMGQVEDVVTLIKKLQSQILEIFSKRSGKITVEAITEKWTRKNWWLTSDEALTLGIVDEVW